MPTVPVLARQLAPDTALRAFTVLLAVTLGTALRLPAQTESPARGDDAALGSLAATLDSLREAHGIPGLIASWSGPDGEVATVALGSVESAEVVPPEGATPMPPDGRMLAASVGKSFVAATVLGLAGEGVLELDSPVAPWVSERPWFTQLTHGTEITIRHLLTHSAGLADHVQHPDFASLWAESRCRGGPPPTSETLIALVARAGELFAPGEGWSYSDTGYLILGLVIEAATGLPVFDAVRQRVLEPLALTHTDPSDTPILPGLVAGWVDPDNRFGLPRATLKAPGVMAWNPAVEGAGGGLVSHPADLVRWGHALFSGSALATPYLHQLQQAVPMEPGSSTHLYGAGIAIRRGGVYGPVLGHAGSIPGYLSTLRHYPRHGVTVALQVNSDGPFRSGPGAPRGSASAGEVMGVLEAALVAGAMDGLTPPPA